MITLDFIGKTALITGGTRGIGRAISRRLAEAGANTIAVYRGNEMSASESLAEREMYSFGVHQNVQADIGDEDEVNALIASIKIAASNGLDYLVLNAGIGLGGKVADVEPAAWRRMFDVNLGSAFLLTRGLIPIMNRGGCIIAIGSGAGHDPIAGLSFYGASKAALNMFIADLALEVGPAGIRANVVSPGSTDASNQAQAPSPILVQDGGIANALRRRGLPDDVAGLVVCLCSDLGSFVTGQAIRINGGAI